VKRPEITAARNLENTIKSDRYSTSRLSPYLAAGVISAREVVRETMKVTNSKKIVMEEMVVLTFGYRRLVTFPSQMQSRFRYADHWNE